MNDFIIKDS